MEIILIILAYLIGSIPTAVWMSEYKFGIDIREYGSGNAGATNTFRILGKKTGIQVLLIDMCKGILAVSLVNLFDYSGTPSQISTLQVALGIAAVVGHIFPIWADFKGGKGIATLYGMVIALNPGLALVLTGIFLIIFMVTHYVSLSSIIAAIAFPLLMVYAFHQHDIALVIFAVATSIMVVLTHQKNIGRLLNGNEGKIYLFKKGEN